MKKSRVHFIQNTHNIPHDEHHIIVADKNLPNNILDALQNPITVQAGENLKSMHAIETLAQTILERRAQKPLTIVAVGGGAIGDAIGFLASILWRGVGLIHVPTTLLAMVDSAHGGKTAVNLGAAKNQLGSFYPADDVYIVREILETLPPHLQIEGLAETVKAAWLKSDDAVIQIDELAWDHPDDLMIMIQQAVEFKYGVVEKDPYDDRDIRIQLNLGHTCAHGIERTAGLSHGESVAWGLLATSVVSPSLSETDRARLFDQAARMIRPCAAIRTIEKQAFDSAVSKDKKRKDDSLRSLVLNQPGDWRITNDLSASDWYVALQSCVQRIDGSASLHFVPRTAEITLPRSKSESIRSICCGLDDDPDPCDDVWFARRAFHQLDQSTISIGEGATPFRFLAVRAAFMKTSSTTFKLGSTLNGRDHSALVEALAQNGVTSAHDPSQSTFTIEEGERPTVIQLRGEHHTSQIASAFLLLKREGFTVDIDLTTMSSAPYFEMTQSMVGEEMIQVDSDASAYAFWIIANDLGAEVQISNPPTQGRQPDAEIVSILARAKREGVVSLNSAPDLAPVLAAWSVVSGHPLVITDAAHLSNKESDRIHDLASSLRGVGVEIDTREDGFALAGVQPSFTGGEFSVHGDHRLVMCAALLGIAAPIEIENAGCVSKSYPRFWQDARRAGWSVSYTYDRSSDT